jgi:hypothetical protein
MNWIRRQAAAFAGCRQNPGRDQAFPGVATRITGDDCVVRFLIRDAYKGAIIQKRISDLCIGADYS